MDASSYIVSLITKWGTNMSFTKTQSHVRCKILQDAHFFYTDFVSTCLNDGLNVYVTFADNHMEFIISAEPIKCTPGEFTRIKTIFNELTIYTVAHKVGVTIEYSYLEDFVNQQIARHKHTSAIKYILNGNVNISCSPQKQMLRSYLPRQSSTRDNVIRSTKAHKQRVKTSPTRIWKYFFGGKTYE